jgi:hypothetical protein
MFKIIFALAVAGSALLAPVATAHADTTSYGAIAVSAGTHTVGSSWDYGDRPTAESVAMTQCGAGDCKILASFTDCGAVSYSRSMGSYTGGYGATRSEAEAASHWYSDSALVKSVCN